MWVDFRSRSKITCKQELHSWCGKNDAEVILNIGVVHVSWLTCAVVPGYRRYTRLPAGNRITGICVEGCVLHSYARPVVVSAGWAEASLCADL